MSTPLTDLLTAAKNIVTAISNLSTQYLNVQGATNTAGIAASTVVKSSAGRLCSISVTTAGSVEPVVRRAREGHDDRTTHRGGAMLVREVMTEDVVTITPGLTLRATAKLMAARKVGSLQRCRK